VNVGLHVLQQAETTRLDERASLTAFAALLLFHRGIELLDAISALAKAGVPRRQQFSCERIWRPFSTPDI